jgi:NAD(P)-dependent dehydrogenase (short-subunit alcohol dehydrogenase family)
MALLEGDAAVVVGAAGGIGRAVVDRYRAEGARVLAVDRDGTRLPEDGLAADASTWEECTRIVHEATARLGGIDVLVSCVGIYDHAARLVDIPGERLGAAFDECFRVNVASSLLLVRAAIPSLLARGGRVVLTGSFAGSRTSGGGILYTAAKHAVVGIVSQLAFELAPKIRVNAVAPGVAPTVMAGLDALGQPPRPSLLPGTEDALPLGVVPDPAVYGVLYALLGSKESSVMTGSIVNADSGLLVRGLAAPAGGLDL